MSKRRIPSAKHAAAAFFACTLIAHVSALHAQDIEPRAYSNTPVGVNFLIAGYGYTQGDLPFGSLPITDASLRTSSAVLAFARALDLWGKSGKFDVLATYTSLSGTARYFDEPVERTINGFSDPRLRLSINLFGAPALTLPEFAKYRQDLIVGMSLQVSAPTGQYDPTRLVNIGTNRWSFKPEVGISKAVDRWTLEVTAAATFYTDNDDFFNGNKRAQDPLYSTQGHAIYSFRSGIWASFDVTYFTGGRTTLNGTLSNDLQQNWRLGGTLALPVDTRNSVKLYASSGVSARTGNSFDLLGIAWQYRWGGGV
jgi:Putative MetA-pathway of phenol degradation